MEFIFHCFVNPTVPCNYTNTADAFNQFAIKFAELMTNKGHNVLFYSNSTEKVVCSEFIQVLTEADYFELEMKTYSFNDGRYLIYNDTTEKFKNILKNDYNNKTIEILKEKIVGSKNEFFFHFYNCTTEIISKYYPTVKNVEMMMGCKYFFAKNVLFSTVSFLTETLNYMGKIPDNYEIIPPLFKKTEFTYIKEKNKTILYLARIQKCKGVHAVFHLASLMPTVNFVIAGEAKFVNNILYVPIDLPKTDQDYSLYYLDFYPNVKFTGFADIEKRKSLLSNCSALIQPTPYNEPFGFNIIEAYLSGTPVITSCKGSFLEIVKNNITGYLCNTVEDYIEAINNTISGKIKSYNCFNEGMKYEMNNSKIYKKYMKFFKNSL
jgi:glycosyltransferase involved in cell wall biosynthesis